MWLSRVKYGVLGGKKNSSNTALKFNPAHRFTFSWRKKVDKKFSQSKNKRIPDKKPHKKTHKKSTKKNGTTTKHPQMVASK